MTLPEIIARLERAQSLATEANPGCAAFPNANPELPDVYVTVRDKTWTVHHLEPETEGYERKLFYPIAVIEDADEDFDEYEFKVRAGLSTYWLVDAGTAEKAASKSESIRVVWKGQS